MPSRRQHAVDAALAFDALEAAFVPLVLAALRRAVLPPLEALTAGASLSLDALASIRTRWQHEVTATIGPAVLDLFTVGALGAWGDLADALAVRQANTLLNPLTDLLDERAAMYLAEASNRLVGIGDTAWAAARDTLEAGFRAGETIEALAERVQHVIDVQEVRAVTIARTEVVGASNAGGIEGARLVLGADREPTKVWIATLDTRTRDEHAEADGQEVPLNDYFDVGGEPLDYPGDPGGSPANVVNCRCSTLFNETGTSGGLDVEGRGQGGVDDDEADARVASAAPTEADMEIDHNLLLTFRQVRAAWRRAQHAPGDEPVVPAPVPGPEEVPAEPTGDATPISMVSVETLICVEGRWTGDDRLVMADALDWEGMLPLAFTVDHEGTPTAIVGLITEVERVPGPTPDERIIIGRGFVDTSDPEGEQTAREIDEGTWRGVSMDIDAIREGGIDPSTVDTEDDLFWKFVVEYARLRALALVAIPAFVESYVTTGTIETTDLAPPVPGPTPIPAADVTPDEIGADDEIVLLAAGQAFNVVEMRSRTARPFAWFDDPHFDGPHAITADGDRLSGHLALWGVCHTGYREACVTAPQSESGYAYFRTGEVVCAGGERVAVGRLTLGTGHADPNLGYRPATDHYDNTARAVADVACGEDEFGIWIAGAFRAGVTDADRHALAASPLSGDWRRIGGSLELVAALAVNVPGFPVPRVMVAGGVQTCLVAAGVLGRADTVSVHGASRRERQMRAAADRLARTIGRDPASRAQALAERVHA